MSLASARFASALTRLSAVFGDAVSFRGASVTVMIDAAPKLDRLPPRLLDLEDGVQAALLTLPAAAVAALTPNTPPVVDEYLASSALRYRIHAVRHLGHAYELACVVSPLS